MDQTFYMSTFPFRYRCNASIYFLFFNSRQNKSLNIRCLSTLAVFDILPRNISLFNASHQKPVVWYLIVFPYYSKWYFFAAVRHFRRSQIRIQKRQIQWVDIPFIHSSKSSLKVVPGNHHRYQKLCNHSHFKLK